MGRLNVYLSDDTEGRLRGYLKKTHGSHRGISIVVEQAISELIDKKAREESLVAAREPMQSH